MKSLFYKALAIYTTIWFIVAFHFVLFYTFTSENSLLGTSLLMILLFSVIPICALNAREIIKGLEDGN